MSSVAIRYCNNQEQAVQWVNEGFMKIFTSLKSFNPDYGFGTWARKVLVNHIIDCLRKEHKYLHHIQLVDFDEYNTDESTAMNLGEKKLEEAQLRQMLEELPNVTKQVFNLFAIDGFKHKEIAGLLGISENTSKWHVNDARKKLKEAIEIQIKVEQKEKQYL
jgi:RNA polymerase sigma-70 factor (ECF subfamily)